MNKGSKTLVLEIFNLTSNMRILVLTFQHGLIVRRNNSMEEKSLAISLNSGIKSCEIFFGSVDISQGRRIEGSRIQYKLNCQALPETLNKKLPENVADVEVSLS